ncbi:MAG: transcription antitermination protein NusB [Planctomycetota bacterium]|jgi:N utilization substance protein B
MPWRRSIQLEHWELARLSPVERNLIRVALGELAGGEVPPKVVINEAIEIGREYGGADSPRFINGILDALWKEDGSEE